MTRDEARRLLAAAGVPDPAGDARRLFEFAYGVGEARGGQERDAANALTLAIFADAITRRAAREPVSHITMRRAFWKTDDFVVTPDVLDPRPETESLVELALSEPFARVLDLGTGSGCILISLLLERPEARGIGTDVSPKALLVAGRNAEIHGVADRLLLPLSDWFADIGGRYDLIVSNPPYITASEMDCLAPEVKDHEPRIALTDEADGLTAYRAISAGAPGFLTPGGRLLVEVGHRQGAAVARLFEAAGLEDVAVHPDLDGRDRVVSARSPSA